MACFIEQGEAVGALFYAPSYQPSPDGILIHFNSQDIEDTLSKVLDKGGKIIIPKTKIEAENKGYFAVLEDSRRKSCRYLRKISIFGQDIPTIYNMKENKYDDERFFGQYSQMSRSVQG